MPPRYQHRVLFWGILGALVMRGAMIGAGAYLIQRFHWIIYVFGAFLVFTGIRMAFASDEQADRAGGQPGDPAAAALRAGHQRATTASTSSSASRCARSGRRRVATPLFVVLVLVETTDLIFAVDSIPAIFAVTHDPFIVYTSNVFAILGLRSLYFLLAGVIGTFRYLQLGLSVVLVFVGAKMLIADWYQIPIGVSLAVVAGVLTISVVASLLFPKVAEEYSPVEHDPLHPPPGRDAPHIPADPEVDRERQP